MTASLYGVRNKEGKWFRSKGWDGFGKNWVDNLQDAKLYNKIGSARSVVSFFANKYPHHGIPELVEFPLTEMIVLDEEERVIKQRDKKKAEEVRQKRWDREDALERARKNLAKAEQDYQRLK